MNDNNYKDQLLRYYQHNFKIYPKYVTTKDEDTNTFQCNIYKGDDYIISGTGNTKKKSEQNASKLALISYRVMSE